MLDVRAVITRVHGLSEERLHAWTAEGLVRPARREAEVLYAEVDVARLRLLVTLEDELAVERETVPVVLGLLDQIHGLRRALRTLGEAVGQQPEEVRAQIRATVAELTRGDQGEADMGADGR